MSSARAPSASGASKNVTSRVYAPTVTGNDSIRLPADTPRYRGKATVASQPSRARAGGREPRTSARPPVFANGSASEPMINTLGRRRIGFAADGDIGFVDRAGRATSTKHNRVDTSDQGGQRVLLNDDEVGVFAPILHRAPL